MLCKGAQIILRCNLWTAQGLCNGSLGVVEDIIYKPTTDQSNHLYEVPICILVRFHRYTGPTIYNGLLPIVRTSINFKIGSTKCLRKQFPLQLAYGISIHRSQGITLDSCVVDIGDSEFGLGLTYVALSRIKTFNGLLIDPAFPLERLMKINTKKGLTEKKKELKRLLELQ